MVRSSHSLFAGWEPHVPNHCDSPNTAGPYTIAIRSYLGCASQCWLGTEIGEPSSGIRIRMGAGAVCATMRQVHWRYDVYYSDTFTFIGTLTHELMHALGFDHVDICNTPAPPCSDTRGEPSVCSLMDTHGIGT